MREEVAALMHEMWSGWMRYLFSKSTHDPDGDTLVVPAWGVVRWWRQLNTPYGELSEDEKDSDRREADKVLALLKEYFASSGRIGDNDATAQSPVVVNGRGSTNKDVTEEPDDGSLDELLRCEGCGKVALSLTTRTIKDDLGERILWLCDECVVFDFDVAEPGFRIMALPETEL